MHRTRAVSADRTSRGELQAVLLISAAILCIALNLRVPTTALGPLLPQLSADLDAGETFLSLLTTIPLALTLIVAPFVPRAADRMGMHRLMALALVGVTVGTLVRSMTGAAALLTGTILLGIAIAVATVLTPATISAQPVRRRGALTGVYTMALSLGPAMALGLTVPIMQTTGFGWRQTLALWAVLGVVALALWLGYARTVNASSLVTEQAPITKVGTSKGNQRVIADPRVWLLAFYLGVTSLTFYTVSAWLPTTFMMDSVSARAAGGYTALVNIVSLPFAFVVPMALRKHWGRMLAPLAPLPAIAGIVLYVSAGSSTALVVALLLGLAQGMCLGVSYDQVVQYAQSPQHAATVSALTSTVGVAIGSLGPLGYGYGLETTGTYVVPLVALAALLLIQALTGLTTSRYSRPRGETLI